MTNDNSDHQQRGHFSFGLFMVISMSVMVIFNTLATLFRNGTTSRVADTARFVAENSNDGRLKKDESIPGKTQIITSQIRDEVAQDEKARCKPVVASMYSELLGQNNWRCACEGGFLPPGLLKTFGGVESVYKMGIGDCYHKKK